MFREENYQASIGAASINYRKSLPPSRRRRFRLSSKCRINQVANRPNAIRDAKRHCWRAAQRFVHSAEIIKRDVQCDGCEVAIEFFLLKPLLNRANRFDVRIVRFWRPT